MKKDWKEYRSAQPLSLFHTSKKPSSSEMELGVRLVCSGKLISNKGDISEISRFVKEVAQVFAAKHAKYYSHRPTNWRKSIESNRGILGCCSRAAAQAELLNTSVEDYIEAQFWFFDEAFGRAPTYAEIAAVGALLRYKKWREALVHDGIAKTTVNVVTGGRFNPKKTKREVVMNYELKVLERMVQQWGSERKVWELFGSPGDEEVFSEEFKRSREIWADIYSK